MNNNTKYYERKFTVYSKSLKKKHLSLIKNVYEHLVLKELLQASTLNIEEGQAELIFFRTCAECDRECYQENNIVKCRTCSYWIHDDARCYKLNDDYGKYCSNCNNSLISNNHKEHNNIEEINNNSRIYNADGDDISEFHNDVTSDDSEVHSKTQTIISESCNTFANKLKQNKSSGITRNKVNESLPTSIAFPNIATKTFALFIQIVFH